MKGWHRQVHDIVKPAGDPRCQRGIDRSTASAGEQNVDGVNQRTQGSGHPRRRQAVARSRVSMSDQPGLWSSARGQQVRGVSQQVGVRQVRDVREPSRFMASVLANKQQVRAMAGPASRRSAASASSRKGQGVSRWSAEPRHRRARSLVSGGIGRCTVSAGEQDVNGVDEQSQGPGRNSRSMASVSSGGPRYQQTNGSAHDQAGPWRRWQRSTAAAAAASD